MSVANAVALSPIDHRWAGVFPLPLTPIEATFLLADDRPGYPMMVDIRLDFDGVLDRQVFNSALAAALRNPLFCCVVGRDPRLGQVWLPTDQVPNIDWAPRGTPLGEGYDSPIDLTKEIGLRIWVRQAADRSMVLLHFHHACGDALGTFGFVEDLLALYSTFYPGGSAITLRPLEPARLLGRGLAALPKRKWHQQVFDFVFDVGESLVFLLQAPASLASPNPPADGARPSRAEMLTRSLGPELTAKVRLAASRAAATVNDVLLCDLFVALRRWNATHGRGKGRKWLRIVMPQSLRSPEDSATPTANIMSFAFLTRRASLCESAAALMRSLQSETAAIRRGRQSVFFLRTLALALSIGFSNKMLASNTCFSTVLLSNLGTPTRRFVAQFPKTEQGLIVGNMVFRSLTGVPALQPGMRAAFTIITSLNDLTLTLKCDPLYFGRNDAARLLDEYVSQVAATAAHGLTGEASYSWVPGPR